MRLLRSSKVYRYRPEIPKSHTFLLVALSTLFGLGIVYLSYELIHEYGHKNIKKTPVTITKRAEKTITFASRLPVGTAPTARDAQQTRYSHTVIKTTVFWVGEPASKDNDFIANKASAWDEQWQEHYGGLDDPAHRTNYRPSTFTPKENPFYFALPYNDIDSNGNRKKSAASCPNSQAMSGQPYSWCKNAWIAIRKDGMTVYAQWQDVGPNEEDDPGYVFGTSAPRNTFGEKAGLDVSPAVRDYLHLRDSDVADWTFVSEKEVAAGPWKQIITSSLGSKL